MNADQAQDKIVEILAVILGEFIITEEIKTGSIFIVDAAEFQKILLEGTPVSRVDIDTEFLLDNQVHCSNVFVLRRDTEILKAMDRNRYFDNTVIDLILAPNIPTIHTMFEEPHKQLLSDSYPRIRFLKEDISHLFLGCEAGKKEKDEFILCFGDIQPTTRKMLCGSARIRFRFSYNEELNEAFPKQYIPSFEKYAESDPEFFTYQQLW
jgi:hypothetical protein